MKYEKSLIALWSITLLLSVINLILTILSL
jgi:hypothetical protein